MAKRKVTGKAKPKSTSARRRTVKDLSAKPRGDKEVVGGRRRQRWIV